MVMNSFEDGGLLSVFAVKAGARRVLIQQSHSSDLALALARLAGHTILFLILILYKLISSCYLQS